MPKPRILVIARENYLDLTTERVATLDSILRSQSTILIPDKEGIKGIIKEIDSNTIKAVLMRTLSVKGLPAKLRKKYDVLGVPPEIQAKFPDSYDQGFSLIDYIHERRVTPIVTEFDVASDLSRFSSTIYRALKEQFGVEYVLTGAYSVELVAESLRKVLNKE